MSDSGWRQCQACEWMEEKAHGDPHGCPSSPARKAELRRAVSASLAVMTAEVRRQKSQLIVKRLLELEEFRRARAVMAYVAMEMEADPWVLVRECWALGKVVAVPRIEPPLESRRVPRVHDRQIVPLELEAHLVDCPRDHAGLEANVFGIWEPKAASDGIALEEIGLVLVPCVAFDRQGYRLGKGGGFYDRFLSRGDLRAASCGLAFSEQVFGNLPRCPHDRAVDLLVTETGVLDFRKGKV